MSNGIVDKKVRVYFDGLCHLCSREINHYRGLRGAENLQFIDITSTMFDAKKENLDPREIHKNMHVKDRDGRLHVGVDAFICLWKELPALRFLGPLAKQQPIYGFLKILYAAFARVRPLLPRKSCEDSPYCELPKP